MHAADLQSLNVYYASYYSSMLTSSNWASLGEPLQTLSELVIGASVASPSLTSRRSARPRFICGYVCMYVFLYLGQQFGERFRRLAHTYVSLKDRNAFEDVRHVQRKTWMLVWSGAMRMFVHGDATFV